MTQLVALPDGTDLSGDYKISRVLGAGGFGITYLAEEPALSRLVSIKEYFPADFAMREADLGAVPRSKDSKGDYNWGLDRFLEEGQTLAKFDHPHIVRVYRIFRAHGTAYMVLRFEEGQSLKSWLKGLKRAPRQKELDAIVAPLLDALETIHKADFLHRDIAPDNVIIRKSGDPVLIDFGAARGELAAHSKTKTVSALVKPGYSPYEQYAESSRQQGPWTDIYALAAMLYHCVSGKRPPDSPSRMLKDEMVAVRDAALAGYRTNFLEAIQRGLVLSVEGRPQSIAAWRGALLAPDPQKPGIVERIRERTIAKRGSEKDEIAQAAAAAPAAVPPPPDAPGPKGGLLDFVAALKTPASDAAAKKTPSAPAAAKAETAAKAKPTETKAAAKSVVKAAAAKRPRPNPDVKRSRPLWRGLKTKIALAAALAGVLIAVQNRAPRTFAGSPPAALTTGTLATRDVSRVLGQSAEFKAHDKGIDSLTLSGDGQMIVTLGADAMLKVWSAETHTLLGSVGLEDGAATSLAVRNHRAAVSHADGAVVVYDLDSLKRLYRFKRNDAAVWSAAFVGSEDVVAGAGHDWAIALWETGSEAAPAALLQGHESAVQSLAVDGAGRWLASGGADRNVKLWNLERLDAPRRTLRNHSDFVSALAFAPDGGLLAAGSLDGGIRLWSASSGRLQRTLSGHTARISALAFSPTSDLLASASDDGAVRLRGLKRERRYWTLGGLDAGAKSLTFSNDGQTLLTGGLDGVVRVWTLPDRQLAQRN
ncbi:MAG: protein kinase domain-containing protein [Hyphomicrobium sp.]